MDYTLQIDTNLNGTFGGYGRPISKKKVITTTEYDENGRIVKVTTTEEYENSDWQQPYIHPYKYPTITYNRGNGSIYN